MKNAPNSKSNLDRALQRFAGDFARANDLRGQMANAIVAQMIGEGVVKGGSGLRFRYGEKLTRVTMDLDTIDLGRTAALCRKLFKYRKVHTWPPKVAKGELWEQTYADQKRDLDVLPTVDEAIVWANDLIAKLDIA